MASTAAVFMMDMVSLVRCWMQGICSSKSDMSVLVSVISNYPVLDCAATTSYQAGGRSDSWATWIS